jgi:hypothetical protein
MTTDTSERLVSVITTLREELKASEDQVAKLRTLLAAAEDYVGAAAPVPSPALTNGDRPPLRQAIVTVIRESHNRGWLLTDLANELWRRKWLGGEEKPSKPTLRQALDNLLQQGMVVAEKQGDDRWAPNLWKLSDKMLTRAPDLS